MQHFLPSSHRSISAQKAIYGCLLQRSTRGFSAGTWIFCLAGLQWQAGLYAPNIATFEIVVIRNVADGVAIPVFHPKGAGCRPSPARQCPSRAPCMTAAGRSWTADPQGWIAAGHAGQKRKKRNTGLRFSWSSREDYQPRARPTSFHRAGSKAAASASFSASPIRKGVRPHCRIGLSQP